MTAGHRSWIAQGTPWIWLNAGAVAVSLVMVVGLLGLLAVRGQSHFWPARVVEAQYAPPVGSGQSGPITILGEWAAGEQVPARRLEEAGISLPEPRESWHRSLYKLGNRDITGADFAWVLTEFVTDMQSPVDVVVVERREWGVFYGYLDSLQELNQPVSVSDSDALWWEFSQRVGRAQALQQEINRLEGRDMGAINHALERLRRRELRLATEVPVSGDALEELASARSQLTAEADVLRAALASRREALARDVAVFHTATGDPVSVPLATVIRAFRPNQLSFLGRLSIYGARLRAFVTEGPREANTEGGVMPAIFGTVVLVLLMSVFVMPFGVIAAVYLREYARQDGMTRVIRIAVNNLAGVPSIVYGVFGLGFFVYFIGAEIDQVFNAEVLPAPTFGTPGLLWASLTLALLTVPVVIVATEEGLSRIPRSVREASLALGATRFETLWRVVLPMASPAIMTGLILAVARAAGEVAPLMLVGVVKLAPALPVDGNFPFLHLDRKFMHLGFHIYDVGFQSPNVEVARPLVYATALLLVTVIALLNLTAVAIRNRLRERYRALEG